MDIFVFTKQIRKVKAMDTLKSKASPASGDLIQAVDISFVPILCKTPQEPAVVRDATHHHEEIINFSGIHSHNAVTAMIMSGFNRINWRLLKVITIHDKLREQLHFIIHFHEPFHRNVSCFIGIGNAQLIKERVSDLLCFFKGHCGSDAALHNGTMKQTFCGRHCHQYMDLLRSAGFPCNGHVFRIAAKGRNIGLYPLKRRKHIGNYKVTAVGRAKGTPKHIGRKHSKCAQPGRNRDQHAALCRKQREIIYLL